MASARAVVGLVAAVLVAAGCRAPAPAPPLPPLVPPPPPPDLPLVTPTPLEPDLKKLPTLDAAATTANDVAPPPAGWRGLTEEVCRREAAARAGTAGLFDRENR